MKCPYQTVVIHQPEYTEGDTTHFAKDTTIFGECVYRECPLYDKITLTCRRAESEDK